MVVDNTSNGNNSTGSRTSNPYIRRPNEFEGISDELLGNLEIPSLAPLDYHTLETKYNFPISRYTYDASKYHNPADGTAKAKLDKYKDLDEALKALIPQEALLKAVKPIAHELRGCMQQCSLQIDKDARHVNKILTTEGFVHKSVNVKAQFHIPVEVDKFDPLKQIMQVVQKTQSELNEEYKKKSTESINDGIKCKVFTYELTKFYSLMDQCILLLAPIFVSYYKQLKKASFRPDPNKPNLDKHVLSVMATRQAFQRLDQEMLSYLNLNRPYIDTCLISKYKPTVQEGDLNVLDKQAMSYTRNCLVYLF